MTYRSRWENLPLDIIYELILSLEDPKEILKLCYDPYINEKICQNKNGKIWQWLYQRDFTDFPNLKVEENLMDKYLEAMRVIKILDIKALAYYSAQNGYEKIFKKIPFSTLLTMDIVGLLGEAAKYGHLSIVKYLVEKGVKFNTDDEWALREATYKGHLDIVRYLIENGADMHIWDEHILLWASIYGHLSIVKYLVENGANFHIDQEKALVLAADNGHLPVVKFLVENGADIRAYNTQAIWVSINKGHSDITTYLENALRMMQ